MAYKYAICVDFEATCFDPQPAQEYRNSEIIEFPAVLIDLKTGKIEAEFHKFVRPVEKPKLSQYCMNLTGITQQIVDNGISVQTALSMFHDWLRKELSERNLKLPKMTEANRTGNCIFITWSDWDFGICLLKECQRKQIRKPPYFNQWIDLRYIYRGFYRHWSKSFGDALSHVGLTFQGRQHSGLADARNLARLAHKMVMDGATLKITKDLSPGQLNIDCNL